MNHRNQVGLLLALLLCTACVCFANGAPNRQATITNDAHVLIKHAIDSVGIPDVETKTLYFRDVIGNVQDYQSDRTYPPYFSGQLTREVWFDTRSGVERTTSQFYFPGSGPSPASTTLSNERSVASVRDSKATIVPGAQPVTRQLNAWAVLLDWQNSPDVTVVGKEVYRDYPRTVLSRKVVGAEERLFLDIKTG